MGVIVVVGLVLVPTIWLVATFNRLVRLRQHVRESWADIDVELKRRYELIPNLVETVRGYMAHERETLDRVIELRNRAVANTGAASSQAHDESALLLGLKPMFALIESYPDLKADKHFLALQAELAETEDRIAAARRFYNGNVRDLNVLRQTVPTSLVASWFSFGAESYFELDDSAERVVPRVQIR